MRVNRIDLLKYHIAHQQEEWHVSTKVNFPEEAKENFHGFILTWNYSTLFCI